MDTKTQALKSKVEEKAGIVDTKGQEIGRAAKHNAQYAAHCVLGAAVVAFAGLKGFARGLWD